MPQNTAAAAAAEPHPVLLTHVLCNTTAPAGGLEAVRDIVGDGEYFMGVLGDGTRLVAPVLPGTRPPMFIGRDVLAELAGCPARSDWKQCVLPGKAEEEAAAAALKAKFAPYDIMG